MLSARRPLPTRASSAQDSWGSGTRRSREGSAGRGARGACRAAAQPRARSGAAASRPQQVGPAGGVDIGGFSETAAARRSWGFRGLCATTFCGGNLGPPAFASHTLQGAESPASPGLRSPRSELAAAAGGLAQTKGAKAAAAERSGARPGPQGGAARTRAYLWGPRRAAPGPCSSASALRERPRRRRGGHGPAG